MKINPPPTSNSYSESSDEDESDDSSFRIEEPWNIREVPLYDGYTTPYRLARAEDLSNVVFDFVMRCGNLNYFLENHHWQVWSTVLEHEYPAGYRFKSNCGQFPSDTDDSVPEMWFRRGVGNVVSFGKDASLVASRLKENSWLNASEAMTRITLCHERQRVLLLRTREIMSFALTGEPYVMEGTEGDGELSYWCVKLHKVKRDEASIPFLNQVAKVASFLWAVQKDLRVELTGNYFGRWEKGEECRHLMNVLGMNNKGRDVMGFSRGVVEVFHMSGDIHWDHSRETRIARAFQYSLRFSMPLVRKDDGKLFLLLFKFQYDQLQEVAGKVPFKVD